MRVLEFYRRQQQLNQTEFAALLRVAQNAISEMERGREPNNSEAAALERTLGQPVKELLKELPDNIVPPAPSLTLAILALRERQAQELRRRPSRQRAQR